MITPPAHSTWAQHWTLISSLFGLQEHAHARSGQLRRPMPQMHTQVPCRRLAGPPCQYYEQQCQQPYSPCKAMRLQQVWAWKKKGHVQATAEAPLTEPCAIRAH